MQPALTPEEWALAAPRTGFIESLDRQEDGRIENNCCACSLPSAHAIAAFALHGQPFGFTREDVLVILAARDFLHQQRNGPIVLTPREDANLHGAIAEYESLAARIEALLPPEPK